MIVSPLSHHVGGDEKRHRGREIVRLPFARDLRFVSLFELRECLGQPGSLFRRGSKRVSQSLRHAEITRGREFQHVNTRVFCT